MRDVSIEVQSDNNLKELFYASSIQILDPSCCLALFVWKIWHLVRNSSISWSLCLLIHLWSCVSLGRSLPLHFSLNLYIKLRVGNSALRLIYLSHDQIVVNFFVCTFIPFLVDLHGYGSKWNYVWSCITLEMFLLFRGPHSVKRTE